MTLSSGAGTSPDTPPSAALGPVVNWSIVPPTKVPRSRYLHGATRRDDTAARRRRRDAEQAGKVIDGRSEPADEGIAPPRLTQARQSLFQHDEFFSLQPGRRNQEG